ncbi:hypothetical protein LMG27952_06101 [Paraburkholderia hiiakae]|uniref:TniQ domain-containing protein n=1 Tax=Paraburkholderia hiiakae TaxID=1081782 RepID=A0ABM8P4S8_9BURK|nr:TniQ family protein [Paraburkholderia hiiakae]CAD6556361.1 hypothetical protein LMG27952_06101 [Paraburkholderia hiiakae]
MLILPKPVDNEFVLGFIGRITHVNLEGSCFKIVRALVAHFNLGMEVTSLRPHYYQAERHIQALALASDKSVDEFLFCHFNFPAERRTPRVAAKWLDRQMCRKNGREYPERKRPYLCRECIPQQVQEFDFPFWHRHHQLPGLYWCPVHKTALLAFDHWLAEDALIPVAALASVRTPATAADFDKYPVLQSFCELMIGSLRRPLWMSVTRIEDCLRRRAIELGLRPDGGDVATVPNDSPFLSDLAFAECPAWWLEEAFGLQRTTVGKGRLALNRVLSGGGRAPPMSYALAIALLFSPRERADILNKSSHLLE